MNRVRDTVGEDLSENLNITNNFLSGLTERRVSGEGNAFGSVFILTKKTSIGFKWFVCCIH